MNREQIEHMEIDREVGPIPKTTIRLEVLIEDVSPETGEGTGNFTGHICSAHGWDDIGTFFYCKARKKPGMRYKQYTLFPFGKHVIVNEWPQ
jgi:hypothetical protein